MESTSPTSSTSTSPNFLPHHLNPTKELKKKRLRTIPQLTRIRLPFHCTTYTCKIIITSVLTIVIQWNLTQIRKKTYGKSN